MFKDISHSYTELKTSATEAVDGYTAIYKATNKINDDFYIGVARDVRSRQWRHNAHANRGSSLKFHRAIRKYGKENFEWEVLWYATGFFEALDEERRLIRILRPTYNTTKGGGGVLGLKMSDESKKKMSLRKKGKPSLNRGCSWPQEMKDRISKTLTGRPLAPSVIDNLRKMAIAKRKAIICLNDGKIYPHSADAAKAYNLKSNAPSRVCRGDRNHIRGYRFAWEKKT